MSSSSRCGELDVQQAALFECPGPTCGTLPSARLKEVVLMSLQQSLGGAMPLFTVNRYLKATEASTSAGLTMHNEWFTL